MERKKRNLHLYGQYRCLAIQLAWKYWKQLPSSAKMWIDPEDFIAEALLHLTTRIGDIYDSRKASMSTFIYCSVSSVLANMLLSQRNLKRFCFSVSLSDENCPAIPKKEEKFQLVDAKLTLEKIFAQASGPLRLEIGRWFGPNRRAPRRSRYAKEVLNEFTFLAEKNGLSESDCRLLLRSGLWQ